MSAVTVDAAKGLPRLMATGSDLIANRSLKLDKATCAVRTFNFRVSGFIFCAPLLYACCMLGASRRFQHGQGAGVGSWRATGTGRCHNFWFLES